MFERNYYTIDAKCPKCRSINPRPKYVPEDRSAYDNALYMYHYHKGYMQMFEHKHIFVFGPEVKEPSTDLIIPDRVDCLCVCGYQWSEK